MYPDEAGTADYIYDINDFELKKTMCLHGLYKHISICTTQPNFFFETLKTAQKKHKIKKKGQNSSWGLTHPLSFSRIC